IFPLPSVKCIPNFFPCSLSGTLTVFSGTSLKEISVFYSIQEWSEPRERVFFKSEYGTKTKLTQSPVRDVPDILLDVSCTHPFDPTKFKSLVNESIFELNDALTSGGDPRCQIARSSTPLFFAKLVIESDNSFAVQAFISYTP